jgi:hypothetical protein
MTTATAIAQGRDPDGADDLPSASFSAILQLHALVSLTHRRLPPDVSSFPIEAYNLSTKHIPSAVGVTYLSGFGFETRSPRTPPVHATNLEG